MAQLYVRVVPGDKKEKLKNILQVLNLIWVILYFFGLFFKHLDAFKMSLRPQWRKIFLQVFNMGWRLRLVVDVDIARTKIRDGGSYQEHWAHLSVHKCGGRTGNKFGSPNHPHQTHRHSVSSSREPPHSGS